MKLRSELLLVLKLVFKEESGKAARLCQLADCTIQQLKRGTLWSNRAEGHVGIVKIDILLDLKESN